MDNYIEIKKQIEKNTENLKQANKKSSELKQNSKDIKDKIDKLKVSKLNKDNYILSGKANFELVSARLSKNDLVIVISLSGNGSDIRDIIVDLLLNKVPICSITDFGKIF